MPAKLVRQGGVFLQHLNISDAFSRPVRQMISHAHVQRLSMLSRGRFVGPIAARAPVLSRRLTNTYATAAQAKSSEPKAAKSIPKVRKVQATESKGTAKVKKTKAQTGKTRVTKKATKKERKPREKKPLTPEQEEKLTLREKKKQIKECKALCLTPPQLHPTTVYAVARAEAGKQISKENLHMKGIYMINELQERISSLRSEQSEEYARIAEENKKLNEKIMADWIKTFTPAQIRDANKARRKLVKLTGKRQSKLALIDDPRLVARPLHPYAHFTKTRIHEDPHIASLPMSERSPRLSAEWKALAPEERKAYDQAYQEDKERYLREYREVYGDEPPKLPKAQRE
ncbi:hypothetical protein ASPACDRAFT_60272 [Aspergillus aculeatus ATCC 16872]|uniref:HMG box domain-containing protein n=1 Tax=Aspergillus aculeatus (strain ATCC 16872 / CBS 172.66 / WB 5094) TaxID=690307 RepID=A0A1L9WW12_ASPA1|nr:uncharacterized protein ASPACDRAFT_60272 [Aspergillus aculeatus ATCC 16872]OJK00445.1 hypothetical protein ASPACDRAFT_60272 [Aspergillus aculeatus ATCC 16872]